ncbi:MAG: helix-turn-helix domain-containing protein [Nitrososphaerota archaeon]
MARQPLRMLILVRDTDCRVCQLLEEGLIEGVFKHLRCGDTSSTHLIQLSRSERGVNSRRLRVSGATVYRLADRVYLIESPSCTACKVISSSPCIPRQAIYIPGVGIIYNLLTPGPRVSKRIVERLAVAGKDVEVVEESQLKLPSVLTKKQYLVLVTAMKMGYLNTPRECTLSELSSELGLSKSTVYRYLKAALKKLALDALLQYEPTRVRGRASLIY